MNATRASNILKVFILSFLLTLAHNGQAQVTGYVQSGIRMLSGGDTLYNGFTGGFNAGQINMMDINGDALADLILFEKTADKFITWIAKDSAGTRTYEYTPAYEYYFPEACEGWVLFRDFDGDGRKDIFTGTSLGIAVYKNVTTGGFPEWLLVKSNVKSQGFSGLSNLKINLDDVPSIADTDGDGDLDIQNLNFFSGDQAEYHKNMSMETYGHNDSLVFVRKDDCWGGFREISCNNYELNKVCTTGLRRPDPNMKTDHVGAGSLTLFDVDGDGDQDLLMAKEDCPDLNVLLNNGSYSFTSVQTVYPSTNPASYNYMPSAFYEDIDADGHTDFLAISNYPYGFGSNYDASQTIWYYRNSNTTANPSFALSSKALFQNKAIDLGSNASPALADIDGDGDQDMLVGYYGLPKAGGQNYGGIAYYQNTGSVSFPQFELVTQDYAGIGTRYHHYNYRIQLYDLNNDALPDLIFNSVNGGGTARIKYILNSGSMGGGYVFNISLIDSLTNFSVYSGMVPCFFNADADTDADLLLAETDGSLFYYLNSSNNIKTLTEVSTSAGGLGFDFSFGNRSVTVTDFDGDGNQDLLTASNEGRVRVYYSFIPYLSGIFPEGDNIHYNPYAEAAAIPNLGQTLTLTTGDINADGKKEIYMGTGAGGVIILKSLSDEPYEYPTTGVAEQEAAGKAAIWPNPTEDVVYVSGTDAAEVVVCTAAGLPVMQWQLPSATEVYAADLSALPKGMYIVKLTQKNGSVLTSKLILQ